MKTIQTAFKKSNREQLSLSDLLSMGVTTAAIDRAVDDEKLRKGCTGYWLPRAADPGALAVMRAAMHDTNDDDDTND